MRIALALAALSLTTASPALAQVREVAASEIQGTLVHGTGEQEAATVFGQLGIGGQSVSFTNALTSNPNNDDLYMQPGQGQADVSGAELVAGGPYDSTLIQEMELFLTNGDDFSFIELAIMGSGTITFTLVDDLGGAYGDFIYELTGGNQFFGFESFGGRSISSLSFVIDGGGAETVGEVRIGISPADNAVPEPGTWAMMLIGFGAAGVAMRRSRRKTGNLLQLA